MSQGPGSQSLDIVTSDLGEGLLWLVNVPDFDSS
jgi:hypothetical protein